MPKIKFSFSASKLFWIQVCFYSYLKHTARLKDQIKPEILPILSPNPNSKPGPIYNSEDAYSLP